MILDHALETASWGVFDLKKTLCTAAAPVLNKHLRLRAERRGAREGERAGELGQKFKSKGSALACRFAVVSKGLLLLSRHSSLQFFVLQNGEKMRRKKRDRHSATSERAGGRRQRTYESEMNSDGFFLSFPFTLENGTLSVVLFPGRYLWKVEVFCTDFQK